jgi:intracellular sulfur oxidation DsrE/DsrF family protein
MFKKYMMLILMAFSLVTVAATATAADDFGPKHKLVIQVSTSDPLTQKIAINNAVNVQKAYGIDNIAVEIVAYGPGLSILTPKSKQAKRIASLAQQNITFSACGNTMKGIKKKTGHLPKLIKGVQVVPAGVGRIMELQEKGYAYVRP